MQKQPLLRNYSEPCDLMGRTLFLISPSPVNATVYSVSNIWGKISKPKSNNLDDKYTRFNNTYAEYESLTGIKLSNSHAIDMDTTQHTKIQHKSKGSPTIPGCLLNMETNMANNFANSNRVFQVYTQGPIHYFKNPLAESDPKYLTNNNHIYNDNNWQNDNGFFQDKNSQNKRKIRITENDTSVEELCYNLNSNNTTEDSVENSLYEETILSQYESSSSNTYQSTERNSESYSESVLSSFNREYRFTTGDISFNMYGPNQKPRGNFQPIISRKRETIFDTDTSVEETCVSLGRWPPSDPNTSQLHPLPIVINSNCLSKKTKKTYLPPLPDTTGSIEMNVLNNDASLIKTGSPQNQPEQKTTANKTFEIPILLNNNPFLSSDKTKLFDKLPVLNNSDNFPGSLLETNEEIETSHHGKKEYQYLNSKYEYVEYIDPLGTTYKRTNIENRQFTETLIKEENKLPEIAKEVIAPNILTETKEPLKCSLNECEKKGIIRPKEVKEPSTIYMDKLLKNKDLLTKFKTGILKLKPEVKINISEEKLNPLSEPFVTELKVTPLDERNILQPLTDSNSSDINATNHQSQNDLEMDPTTNLIELDDDSVLYEAASVSQNVYSNSVEISEITNGLNEKNIEHEDEDNDDNYNLEFDLNSAMVVELQKTDTVPAKKTKRYGIQLKDEPFNQISNVTPLPPVNIKSDRKAIIKNMEDIPGNELRAFEEFVEIEGNISKMKAYTHKNNFSKSKLITETTHVSEEGYELKLVKPIEDLSVHDVLLEGKQKKNTPDKSIKIAASKQDQNLQLLSTKYVKSLKSEKNKQQIFKSDPITKKSPDEKIKPHMASIKKGTLNGINPRTILEKHKTDISHSLRKGITKLSDPTNLYKTGRVQKQKTNDLKTRYLSTRNKKDANDVIIADHQNIRFSLKHRKEFHKSKTEPTGSIKHFDTRGIKHNSGIPNLKKHPEILSDKQNISNRLTEHVLKNKKINPFERVIVPIPHPPKYLETPVFDVTIQQRPSKEREFTQAIVGEMSAANIPLQQSMKENTVNPSIYSFLNDSALLSTKQTPCLCNIINMQSKKVDATTSTTDTKKKTTSYEHQSVLEPQIYFAPTTQLDIPIYDNSHSEPTVFHIELNEPKVCVLNRRSATELSPIQLQCRPILSRELHQLSFPKKYAAKSQLSPRNKIISKSLFDRKQEATDKPTMMKDSTDKPSEDLLVNKQHELMPHVSKEDKQTNTNYLNRIQTKNGVIDKAYKDGTNQCECLCRMTPLDSKQHKHLSPVQKDNRQTQTDNFNNPEIEKDLTGKSNSKMQDNELHVRAENKQIRPSNLDNMKTNTEYNDKSYELNDNQCQCLCHKKSLDNKQHELIPHIQKQVRQAQTEDLCSTMVKKDLKNKSNENLLHDKQQKIMPSNTREVTLISSSKYKSVTNLHTTETKTETVAKCDTMRSEELRDNQILKREVVSKHDTTKTETRSREEKTEITSIPDNGDIKESRLKQPITEHDTMKTETKSRDKKTEVTRMPNTADARDSRLKSPVTDTTVKREDKHNTTKSPGSNIYETNKQKVDLRTPGALRQQLINDKVISKNEVLTRHGKISPDKLVNYENNRSIHEDAKNILDSVYTKVENMADNTKYKNLITVNQEEKNRLVTTQPHSQVKVISEDVADNNDDAVVIYIRQTKTSTTHIQPMITVDLSKRKQLSSSEVAIQSINFTEIDPDYEGVIRRQSFAFRNNELQKTDVKFGNTDPGIMLF